MATTPRIAAQPSVEKKPTTGVEDPDVVKNAPVSWGLRWLDLNGQWSWRKLNPDDVDELHRELVALEGKTLHDLLRQGKVKDIPADHMKIAAKARLKELRLEEADTLWELRLPSKWRAWGLVERSTFYFLWWDESETVCNPPPKGERRS